MESINSNDKIRAYIYENLLTQGIKIKDDSENLYEKYANKLKKLLGSDAPVLNILSSSILIVSFCDAYMILKRNNQFLGLTKEEKKLYNLIKNMVTIENLMDGIKDVPDLLQRILPYSIKFYEMDYLKKVMCINSLSDFELRTLAINYPSFENDIEEYINDLSLDTIADYSKKVLEEEENESIVDQEDIEDNLMESLDGFFKFLAGCDFNTYEELVENIIRLDYKWNRYFKDLRIKNQIENEENIIFRMQMFETNDIADLVYNEFMINEEYREELLCSFIAIKCYNMGIEEIYINEDTIDKHFDNARGRKLLQ